METIIGEPLHIVGLGCGGSRVGRHLAERGADAVHELHGWDGDIVEEKNVGPQLYNLAHVGMNKADALAKQMSEWGGPRLIPHAEFIDGPRALSGFVIVAVDKMRARWTLWEHSTRRNPDVQLMIELRLETTRSYIYVVNPNDPEHVRHWERSWYDDDDATTAGLSCGVATARYPIADLTANVCVTQLLRAVEIQGGSDDRLENDIRVKLTPLQIQSYTWGAPPDDE